MKNNYLLNHIKYRFLGIRKELRYLFLISIISILIAELMLSSVNSINNLQYGIGLIYLKLCYSFLSAFIFYYLVVYAPKERKRIKAFRMLTNKIQIIKNLVDLIIYNVAKVGGKENLRFSDRSTYEDVKKWCVNIGINDSIYHPTTSEIIYSNFYEFLHLKTQKIKTSSDQLLILNDLLDDNLFLSLSNIHDIIAVQLTFDLNTVEKENYEFVASGIWELQNEAKHLKTSFNGNFYKRYHFEYIKMTQSRYL